MARKLKIADAHTQNKPKQVLTIELEGGSPWYSHIWINDVCYTIVQGARTVKIHKTKFHDCGKP